MPTYDFQCTNCEHVLTKMLSLSEHARLKVQSMDCSECDIGTLKQVILSTPGVSMPASFTHDGKHKTLIAGQTQVGKIKDEAQVPLNIIDELPDGTTRVTRIGRKQDIDNE